MIKKHKKQKQNAPKIESPIQSLVDILRTCRPAGSQSLQNFIHQWIAPLGAKPDAANNWILRIGESRVLWSSHTDSVHAMDGFQRIVAAGDTIRLAHGDKSNCLGADCGTGIWIMREMILNRVAGLYIFHDSEECGGIGSSYIASKTPALLDGIDYAIAFDRRGTNSIITHQGGTRCASDAFAASIAPMLPQGYRTDSGGTFTDTACYTHLISECTNLSVGYDAQHTDKETQSINHALALRESMLAFDESRLIASRDPNDWENDSYWSASSYYGPASYDDLSRWIARNPDLMADYIESRGFDLRDIKDWADKHQWPY